MNYISDDKNSGWIPLVSGPTLYYNWKLRPLMRYLWDTDPGGWLNMVSQDGRQYTITWMCGDLHFQITPKQIFVWKGEKHICFFSDYQALVPPNSKLYEDFVLLNEAVIETIKSFF